MILENIFFLILHIAGNNFPKPLSPTKEREEVEKMMKGDREARTKLIESNLRLVAHIAKKYFRTPEEQDDLISIGSVGLIKAIDSFNGDRKTKLSTYAAKCIENEILMYFRGLKKTAGDISIEDEIDCDKDGNSLSLIDILYEEDSVADMIYGKIRTEKLRKAIENKLSEREKTVICLRYGLTEPSLTQKETADRLGISRSYVSRIEKRALDILKEELKE